MRSRVRVLFFDDYPQASENALFLLRLRRHLGDLGPHLHVTKTVAQVEHELRSTPFQLAILDVMAAASEGFGVSSSMAGIEVLRRCRGGVYSAENVGIPIFMRTGRGEMFIRDLCAREGCTGFFGAGADDSELLKAIQKCFGLSS